MNFEAFPPYRDPSCQVPVCCVTPEHGAAIHRFFDTSPISPSGKYLAACVLPYENRLPSPGDLAKILLVDLETGKETIIAETRGWGIQVGANLQWGGEGILYYNDVDTRTWVPCLVRHDIRNGSIRRMGQGIFMLSPDGRFALTHNLSKSRLTQTGYGVAVPDAYALPNGDHPEDDGFFRTDTLSGQCTLFMPLSRLIDEGLENLAPFRNGQFYGFQCKWSPDGQRILYVMRCLVPGEKKHLAMVFTSDAQGEDIRLALHWKEWAKGGHHVNWHPDSRHITMNLILNGEHLKFVSFGYDGSNLHPILDEIFGSGHPSFHRDGKHLLTDAYVNGDPLFAKEDGTVPLRLIDTEKRKDSVLLRMKTQTGSVSDFRVDPHPAWSYDFRYIAFNGYASGTRRVYVCEANDLLKEP